jgi:large subunit ribosomal protein L5
MNIQQSYQEQLVPKLKESLSLKNDLSVPRLSKVVLNAGVAEGISNSSVLEKVQEQLATISGQRPRITRAKKSISSFKLKEKDQIGVTVTLRGKKAWNFLERFIGVVMPRMRDFRGLPIEKFDKFGNYNLGIPEQILFPEIDYSKIDKVRGLVVTLVIKNSDPEKSKQFLELLGFKFRNI